MKESILIFKPAIARHLLKLGYQIIDIKAQKEDANKTVFVFKNQDGLEEILKTYQN